MPDPIPALIEQVDAGRLRDTVFHLASDPLPYRKANYTLPGHAKTTLEETDDFIQGQLEAAGYAVEREECQVQALRWAPEKPRPHQFERPTPDDPWYTVYNLYAKKQGTERPDEIVVVISHKDSQSWTDSPGANDNAAGTAGNMEIARLLASVPTHRSIWFVYCNEEHVPWTSEVAARHARERGDKIVAVFNLDGLGAKGREESGAGRKTNVIVYVGPEGIPLADRFGEVNEAYGLGLVQSTYHAEKPNDDHGSYIKEGFPAAVLAIGSYPYADPNYHHAEDTADKVDIENLALATKACLAAILRTAG